jgi:hypothetical protein
MDTPGGDDTPLVIVPVPVPVPMFSENEFESVIVNVRGAWNCVLGRIGTLIVLELSVEPKESVPETAV